MVEVIEIVPYQAITWTKAGLMSASKYNCPSANEDTQNKDKYIMSMA